MSTDVAPPTAIAITGPTTSGKTALSVAVAEEIGAEIVSMDSRQIYRGMDIGTDKVTGAARGQIPHHGLDILDPRERYSAGAFARDARIRADEIRTRGRFPLFVGGTGFFLKALTEPLFAEPPLDPTRRAALRAFLGSLDQEQMARWLATLDPERAGSEAPRGAQRMVRALEIALLTGRSLAWWHRNAPPEQPPVPLLVFLLRVPREVLDRRIDARVSRMVESGLVREVQSLLDAGVPLDAPGMTGTGYREIAAFLQGECSLEEAVDAIRRATRGYARRQDTWFRNQLPADRTVILDGELPEDRLVEAIRTEWEARRAGPQGGMQQG